MSDQNDNEILDSIKELTSAIIKLTEKQSQLENFIKSKLQAGKF